MISYGYLLNHGYYLYRDFAHPYEPLLSIILALVYKVFGYDSKVLEIFTWTLIILTDLLVTLLSIKLIGQKYWVFIPVLFWVFAQSFFQGNGLWFDLGSMVFVLISLVFISEAEKDTTTMRSWSFIVLTKNQKWGYFWGGLFLGLAFLVKQQQAVIFGMIFFYWLMLKKPNRVQFNFFLGAGVVVFITLILILQLGLLKDYLFWTVEIPLIWYPTMPGYSHLPTINEIYRLILIFLPGFIIASLHWKKLGEFGRICLVFFLATFIIAFPRFEWFRLQTAMVVYVCLYICLMSILNESVRTKSPRFLSRNSFFSPPHRFALAFIRGLIVHGFSAMENKRLLLMLIVPTFLGIILVGKDYLGVKHPDTRFYDAQTFKIASTLKQLSSKNDRIYLLNLNSLIYVLADRLPPKPWVDNYIWYFEVPNIQERVISGFIQDNVKLVVWKEPYNGNWFDLGTYQPKLLTDYIRMHYKKGQQIDEGVYLWQKID